MSSATEAGQKASTSTASRLTYVDWLRGLACVLMFQTHCYDSWLSAEARHSVFYRWSRITGTLPAPLFLFLAGISFALVTDRLLNKDLDAGSILRFTLRRGAEIFALGLLFRLQEYLVAWKWSPVSDLFRVDILNTIGVSMMLMAVTCWVVLSLGRRDRFMLATAGAGMALAIAMLAPMLWTVWRPRWLPWPLESYVNGVHNLDVPQPGLFPIFPWSAFAFVGLATGFLLFSDWGRKQGARMFGRFTLGGIGIYYLAIGLDALPVKLYPVYDFWHTSPNFFLARAGVLLAILVAGYAWCRWGAGQWGFSPFAKLGQASLLVYWVHIELVYGRISILPKHSQDVWGASLGLLVIFLAMLALAWIRIKLKGRKGGLLVPPRAVQAGSVP